jgi:hypothetical protein
MKIIKCLIVDDEPPVIRLLEKNNNAKSILQLIQDQPPVNEALAIIEQEKN